MASVEDPAWCTGPWEGLWEAEHRLRHPPTHCPFKCLLGFLHLELQPSDSESLSQMPEWGTNKKTDQ